jgi:Rad3-related DNA helicase
VAAWITEEREGNGKGWAEGQAEAQGQAKDQSTPPTHVDDSALLAWNEGRTAEPEALVMAEVNKAMGDLATVDPIGPGALPPASPIPFTPQQWAEWRPPVLGSEVPPWIGKVKLPPWAPSLRPWQVTAVDEVMAAFREGYKYVFLEAPTGAGKTLIGEMVRQLVGVDIDGQPNARACYVCTTKSLQDQFVHDFPAARVIKGKGNYPTANYPAQFNPSGISPSTGRYDWMVAKNHFSCAECTFTKTKGCDGCSRAEDGDRTFLAQIRCPYRKARDQARWAPLSVLNTAYFIAMANSGFPRDDENGGPGFAGRELVILDEFDLVEGVLMSQVEIVISKRTAEKLRLSPPKVKSPTAMGGKASSACWAPWIEEQAIPKINEEVERIKQAFERGDISKREQVRKSATLSNLVKSLQIAQADMADEDGSAWIYDGYNDKTEDGQYSKVVFKPVRVDKFGAPMLWAHAKRFLCMSATLLDAKMYARDIGVDPNELKIVKIPSSFPPQQRPIVQRFVAENTMANRDQAWPKMARAVAKILVDHPEDRVLVHTVSYPFTEYLIREVKDYLRMAPGDAMRRCLLSYANANERERVLNTYKGTKGAVMFAPSFDRGIDLPGDLCRVQVVAKVPYASKGDKQVAARLYSHGGSTWYSMEAIRTLVQMVGRGMRKPDDWCWTYLLDANFLRLYRDYRHIFPEFFCQAVFPADYAGMTVEEYERRRDRGWA